MQTKESLAEELIVYVDNDADLYRQKTTPIIKNLVKKMASGKYDREKAVTLFMYLADAGAQKYAFVEGVGSSRLWPSMFPIDVRRMAATHWRDSFESEAKLGNYDEYIPKKYQKAKSVVSSPAIRSRSFESGYRDGASYARQMPSLKKGDIDQARELGHASEILSEKATSEQSHLLGVSSTDVQKKNRKYLLALERYDSGFCDGALSVIER